MQLTKHTDYALRTLMYLGCVDTTKLTTINVLAEQLAMPKNHLMKVVSRLAREGYIESIRGPKGGVRISSAAFDATVGDLVRMFEVTIDLVNCGEPMCPINSACELKVVLNNAQTAFLSELDRHTLAKLIPKSSGLNELVKVVEL